MARVQRNNVVLTVRDDEVQRYIQLGYNLTSPSGEILQAAMPNDLGTLQKLYNDQTARIAELEATITHLTAELDSLKKKPARAKSTKTTDGA